MPNCGNNHATTAVKLSGNSSVIQAAPTMARLPSKPRNMAKADAEPIGGAAACNTRIST